MARVTHLLCGFLIAVSSAAAQVPPPAAPDPFFIVVYVELAPAGRAAGTAALTKYREESGSADGWIRTDLLEQIGRPGYFVMVESWRDQKAFDAGATAARMRLLETLKPIRLSGWDERPYKALTSGGPTSGSAGDAISVVTHVDVSMDPKVPSLLRALAEASRQEPGNLRFDVLQHTVRANHFTIVETWRDERARQAHAAAAHTRQFREDVQPMTGSPLDARLYIAIGR